MPDHHSPALHIWKFLNPKKDPLLHLYIKVPIVLTFRLDVANVNWLMDKAQCFWFVRTFRLVL
jgi:hypothetical protein